MLKDVILRIKDKNIFTSEPEFSHVILSQDWEQWPCGTPLVVDRKLIKVRDSSSVRVFALFPPRSFINKMEDFTVVKESLVDTALKPLIKTHRTLSVDAFDCAKFDRLKAYVRDTGGITFVVKEESARRDLVNVLKFFPGEFKYTSLFHYAKYSTKHLTGKDDNLLGIISFFDLPYCIPLFNLKKVDGMGVSYCQAPRKISEKSNTLIRSYRVDIILSNYADNIFVIDGSDVNPLSPIHGDLYRELKEWTREEMKVRDKASAPDYNETGGKIRLKVNQSYGTTSATATATTMYNNSSSDHLTGDG